MKKITFIFLLLTLFSCSSKNKELIINFENSGSLNTQSEVICNGKTIGHVTDLHLLNPKSSVNIHILLDIDGLPIDSKFTIRERDLLNNAIYVSKGKSNHYLSKSDKIVGEIKTVDNTLRRDF